MALQPDPDDPLPYQAQERHIFDANELPIFEAIGNQQTCDFIAVACNSYHDLLAALRELVEQAESYCDSTGHKVPGASMYGTCDAICRAISVGRDALAKAEGRA